MRGGWQGARSPARGRRRRRRRAQLNHKPQARHILYHLAIGCSPNIARHPSAYRTARCKSRLCCTRHSTLSLSRSSPQGGATSAGSLLPLPLPPPPLASGSAHDCSSASSCLAVVGSWRRYRAAACQRRRHTATSTSPSAASPCRSIRAWGEKVYFTGGNYRNPSEIAALRHFPPTSGARGSANRPAISKSRFHWGLGCSLL
mmetsp:Transcript_5272/g.17503  ORF Transcript_5272/g.17503 Transcript_5272/m.17503 type:complete len:202 (+) Transcript_5272:97-702(+)